MNCSYCEQERDHTTAFRDGMICDECIAEAIIDHGDPAIYSNNYFDIFLNKDHISFGFGVSWNWYELDLGIISIKSK